MVALRRAALTVSEPGAQGFPHWGSVDFLTLSTQINGTAPTSSMSYQFTSKLRIIYCLPCIWPYRHRGQSESYNLSPARRAVCRPALLFQLALVQLALFSYLALRLFLFPLLLHQTVKNTAIPLIIEARMTTHTVERVEKSSQGERRHSQKKKKRRQMYLLFIYLFFFSLLFYSQ